MNYYSYLIFLIVLSSLTLVTVFVLYILDLASVTSKQKITFLKINSAMIGVAPVAFYFLKMFSWQNINVTLQSEFIKQLPMHILYIPLTKAQVDWSFYIICVYGLGVFVMFFRILLSYVGARRQLTYSIPAVIQEQSVFISKNIKTPLSFGLPTAKIYFPFDFEEKWTPREIQMSIAHEKNHLKHNDSLWKFISLFARALLFFLPWSYYLHRKFELEMEIFCDEITCATTTASTKEYGNLLLAMTCIQSQNLIFTNITDSTLKRRFLAMKSKSIKRPFLMSMCCSALLLSGSTAIAVTSGMLDKKTDFDILSKIYMDGELVSSPRIIAHANQKASIFISDRMTTKDKQISMSGNSLRLELIARDAPMSGKNDIKINYDIQCQNGKEKMHSKPEIIVTPNQEGVIRISDAGHSYEMHVLAKRQ